MERGGQPDGCGSTPQQVGKAGGKGEEDKHNNDKEDGEMMVSTGKQGRRKPAADADLSMHKLMPKGLMQCMQQCCWLNWRRFRYGTSDIRQAPRREDARAGQVVDGHVE